MTSGSNDFLSALLGGNGCAVDGTLSSNPISSLVDRLVNSNILNELSQSLSSSSAHVNPTYTVYDGPSTIGVNSFDASVNQPVSSFDQAWHNSLPSSGVYMGQSDPQMAQQSLLMEQHRMMALQQRNLYHQHLVQQQQWMNSNTQNPSVQASTIEGEEGEGNIQYEERYSDDILDSIQQLDINEEDWLHDPYIQSTDNNSNSLYQQDHSIYNTGNVIPEYRYQSENELLHTSNAYEKGLELFTQDRIKEAILAFEAELQNDSTHDECWRYLGLCWSELDEDTKAIMCYNKALEQDAYNMDALIGLGKTWMNVYIDV